MVFGVGAEALKDKQKRTSIWSLGKFTRGGRDSMLCFIGCICYNSGSDQVVLP